MPDPQGAIRRGLPGRQSLHHAQLLHVQVPPRLSANDILHVVLRPTQVGGRRGMGCSTAVHLASSFLAKARQEGRTAIAYFVDLRAA